MSWQRPNIGSRVTREGHARFWERPVVKMDKAKPFKIPKREVWEAFKRVKANQGAAGVDGQSIPYESQVELRATYMPDATRAVSGIPRANPGGRVTPRFWHRLNRFRHFCGGSLALASLDRACRNLVPAFHCGGWQC